MSRRLTTEQAVRNQQRATGFSEATTSANVGYAQNSRIGDAPVRAMGDALDRLSIPQDYVDFLKSMHGFSPTLRVVQRGAAPPCKCLGKGCTCS